MREMAQALSRGAVYLLRNEEDKMTFLEFAQTLPEHFSDQEFVDHLNKVIDLRALQNLPPQQRQAVFDAAQYLADFMLLITECKGEQQIIDGTPCVTYRGPVIANVLNTPSGVPVDCTQLETLGVDNNAELLSGTDV